MAKEFVSEIEEDADGQKVLVLTGPIDESATLPDLNQFKEPLLEVDLGGVTFINSLGVRKWTRWVSACTELRLVFVKVPTVVIDQMNMVDGFFPEKGLVQSFFVPYFCENCDHEEKILYHRGREFGGDEKTFVPVAAKCPQCQHAMEVSVLADKYFYFLNIRSPHATSF